VDLGLREVVRHVTPAGGDVVLLRHPVQQDLLGRQSAGEARREVAVIREEIVVPGAERDAEGDLDAVVPRARRVVRPAEALFEVVRSLVVEQPPEMHQGIPPPELVPARGESCDGRGG
jgi:hypothetical protein